MLRYLENAANRQAFEVVFERPKKADKNKAQFGFGTEAR